MKTEIYTERALSAKERWLFWLALGGCGCSILPLPLMFLNLWPLNLSIPLLVSPSLLLLLALGVYARMAHVPNFARHYAAGFCGGFVGTIFYDLARLGGLYYNFPGFKVIIKFGMLMTGQTEYSTEAALLGWAYHFMNGGVFGITYALIARERGNILWGILWGLILEIGMLATYPTYFGLNMEWASVAFNFSMLGHVAYGSVLGYVARRMMRKPVLAGRG